MVVGYLNLSSTTYIAKTTKFICFIRMSSVKCWWRNLMIGMHEKCTLKCTSVKQGWVDGWLSKFHCCKISKISIFFLYSTFRKSKIPILSIFSPYHFHFFPNLSVVSDSVFFLIFLIITIKNMEKILNYIEIWGMGLKSKFLTNSIVGFF